MSQTEVQLIKDAVIVNADVSNSAAIDVSKISGAMPLTGGTFTDDVTFTGANANIVFDKSDNALEFGNDVKAVFGADSDLEISHENSTDSNIINSHKELKIYSNGNTSLNTNNADVMVKGIKNGAVELYHDNSKKFETTSSGVSITGGLTASGASTFNEDVTFTGANYNAFWDKSANKLKFNDNAVAGFGTNVDLEIKHDGSNSKITHGGSGGLYIGSDTFALQKADHSENYISMAADGAVELYHNGTKMIETTSTGTSMPDGKFAKFGASDDLAMGHNTFNYITYTGASFQITGDSTNDIILRPRSNEFAAIFEPNAAVKLYYDNVLKLETTSLGTKTSGRLEQFSADGNTSFRRDVYYLAIPTQTTKTITLTTLNGTGVFRAGGYTNAGQGALALHILFGGAMFATQHYQVNELINSGMQNTSISTSKNSTNYTIAITNSSTTFSLILGITLESTGSTMGYAVA